MPEVKPVLGRDITFGDYLNVALVEAGNSNDKTSDENYQEIIETLRTRGILTAGVVQIYQ